MKKLLKKELLSRKITLKSVISTGMLLLMLLSIGLQNPSMAMKSNPAGSQVQKNKKPALNRSRLLDETRATIDSVDEIFSMILANPVDENVTANEKEASIRTKAASFAWHFAKENPTDKNWIITAKFCNQSAKAFLDIGNDIKAMEASAMAAWANAEINPTPENWDMVKNFSKIVNNARSNKNTESQADPFM